MDTDGDGQVAKEDAHLNLGWATGLPGGLPAQPVETESQLTSFTTASGDADMEALVGKWKMIRMGISPKVPDKMPEWVVNTLVPKVATKEIFRDGDQLKIEYGGRNTWYRNILLGGIHEGATVVREGQDSLPCVFEAGFTFSYDSLSFGIGLIYRDIKQIRGLFISNVNLLLTGTSLEAIITVDNVKGTYYDKGDGDQTRQKSINFAGTSVKYRGFRK